MKKRILRIALSALLGVGIVCGAALAQKLTAEKREDALPLEPEKLAASFSLCDGLEDEDALRASLTDQLRQPELQVTLCGMDTGKNTLKLATDQLSERQAKAVAALLVASDLAAQELNGFAAPSAALSEAELCRLRDDCFLLADRLDEILKSETVIDADTAIVTEEKTLSYLDMRERYFIYQSKLNNWAKAYCPTDWSRTFLAEQDSVRGLLEMEYAGAKDAAVKDARKQQMEQADQLLADVKAGRLDPQTALDRLNALWDHRDDGIK